MTGLELRFPSPGTPLSENASRRMHWAARSRYLQPWRDAVGWAWLQNRAYWWKVKGVPCTVEVEFAFKQNRRRDPANYICTVKAIVDETVSLGIFKDDLPK